MSTIGERIKHIRKSKGLTQQKFADTLGLKQNTVATYEMNKTVPSDRTISDICREFEVDRIWLETGAGEPFRQPSRDEKIAQILAKAIAGNDSARDRMIRALCSLPDEYFPVLEDAVKKYVEALKQEKGEA